MSNLEIYELALDDLLYRFIPSKQRRCAWHMGKPTYADVKKDLEETEAKAKWLIAKIEEMKKGA